MFTLCIVISATLLQSGLINEKHNKRLLFYALASTAIGIACLFRYMGVAFVAGLGAVALQELIRGKYSVTTIKASSCLLLPATTFFLCLLVNNYLLTGHLTGGPSGPESWSLADIAAQCLRSLPGLFGDTWSTTGKIITVVFIVVCGTFVFFSFILQELSNYSEKTDRIGLATFSIASILATSGLIFTLLLKNTAYVIEARYFVPLIPITLIGFATLWPSTKRTPNDRIMKLWHYTAVCLAFLSIAWYLNRLEKFAHEGGISAKVSYTLSQKFGEHTWSEFLKEHASIEHPVMSNQSQALYVNLRGPTLGIPERRLTPKNWSPDDVINYGIRFGVKYLVVFPQYPLGEPLGTEDFVLMAALARKDLYLLHRSNDLIVLKLPTTPNNQ